MLAHETEPTEPAIDVFLDVIRSKLEAPTTSRKTRGNALWALVFAVRNQSASEERLIDFVELLICIFKRTDDNPTCIIYAAWALTSICAQRATDKMVVDIIARPDVFLHLSGLLRAQFPRHLEKLAIFSNVVRMLTPSVNKVCQKNLTILQYLIHHNTVSYWMYYSLVTGKRNTQFMHSK